MREAEGWVNGLLRACRERCWAGKVCWAVEPGGRGTARLGGWPAVVGLGWWVVSGGGKLVAEDDNEAHL